MDKKKGILLVALAAAFLAALICVAVAFFPRESFGQSGGYFVGFSLSDEFYVDGEPLSSRERSQLCEEIAALLREIEDEVSVEKSGSDISRINAAAAGEQVAVGEHTWALLRLCKQIYSQTAGAFSPALYNLTELWGFSPAYEGHYTDPRPEPSAQAVSDALAASDFSDIELRDNNIVVKANGDTKLDFGGVAKGYMSDAAAALIRETYAGKSLDGILTVMSNSVLFGQKHDASVEGGVRGYTMEVENPRSLTTGTGCAAVAVGLSDVAVSTSADNYRFYVNGGKIYSHILDPNTGKPSENGVISVTVLVPLNGESGAARAYAGAVADALSTTGFCMPLKAALEFYESIGVGAVVITSEFEYYVVGDYEVLDPGDFSEGAENVFARCIGLPENSEVGRCKQELAYIEKVAELTGA